MRKSALYIMHLQFHQNDIQKKKDKMSFLEKKHRCELVLTFYITCCQNISLKATIT